MNTLKKIFGFAFEQPLYQTLLQMRILQVCGVIVAFYLVIDFWQYAQEYALKHPDAQWLTTALPAFIASNTGALWALIAEIRKSD